MSGKPPEDEGSRQARWSEYRQLLDVSVIGLVFPLSIAFGYLFGRLIGALFGAERLGAAIGVVFGILAGFYNVFKTLHRLDRREAAKSDSSGAEGPSGGDPRGSEDGPGDADDRRS